ncbi:Bug family tripartite tricarboxylate transporter substrate binding protein [Pelagibacterium halotolerans]|uniref:Putative exported protein n=1 Tax=Pelagibacterium halotolerans (strain DSM 22347 / JCM 15775 / CGMCC 1.7692 / B2) TaxID=1082931 RepID=G4R8D7_PELHB|nr:tripartite tricarboxylate transporter substrate binding protein [Pelagibacterium halotolerans]AEQ52381.1 putative exported protein [Pelagibacterium halotolerans B2]SEA34848.1 Tripartite-type tricarboxylate transporter, receptor component TctC [Pelagibacterium halotolerans]
MKSFVTLALGVSIATLSAAASAQEYPTQAIRMVVPFSAGGPADTIARVVSQKMGEILGQPIVIENRGGAGGVIGTDLVAKGAPDGYLIGMSSAGALAISASVQQTMPYDATTDFAPVTLLASVPELLVVNDGVEAETFDELLELARAEPGALNFASSGPGSMPHLAGELLNIAAEIEAVHVPYAGAAPAVTDLLGGQVQFMFADIPVLLPHVQEGTLRALAVGSAERTGTLPDVATTAELGMPDVTAENWYGIVAPPGTPEDVVATLNAAIVEALADEGVAETLGSQGANLIGSSPQEFGDYIASETEKWAEVVEVSGAMDQ